MIVAISHMIKKLGERLNTRYSHWLISELKDKAIRLSEINHRRKKLGKEKRTSVNCGKLQMAFYMSNNSGKGVARKNDRNSWKNNDKRFSKFDLNHRPTVPRSS